MHAEDEHPPGDVGERREVLEVAVVVGDLLVLPARERVGAGRGHHQAVRRGHLGDRPAQPDHLVARLGDRAADAAADLDLRLHQLGLDLVLEHQPALLEELLDVGGQLPALRVDELVLLLDADGELWQGHDAFPGRVSEARRV